MDYEKKYNEAIERMRKMLGPWRELAYNGKSFLQDLESIFPELHESDDERNWKAVLEYIKDDSLRSWLKKQKEQNHDGKKWIYEDEYHKDMERCFNDGKDEVLENPEKYGLRKEQRSNEDDDPLNDGRFCKGFDTGREVQRILEEPSWSEEDERILKGIIGKIDHDQTYGVSKAEMLSFLEGLRPSWKPSEEQISSLKQARDYYMSGRIKYVGQHLSEIAEQLEKL